MLEKITYANATDLSKKKCQYNTYFVNPFYLAYNGYFETLNGELLLFERDILSPNTFPFIGLPKNPKNFPYSVISYVSKKDIQILKKHKIKILNQIPLGHEYYYKTQDFIDMAGKDWKNFRRGVNTFKRKYNYIIKKEYNIKDSLAFLEKWKSEQKLKTHTFEVTFDVDKSTLIHSSDIEKTKTIFIEINNCLVGLRIGYPLNSKCWVGLTLKVNYRYKGLSRFLIHELSKEFERYPFTTSGTEAFDPGIRSFKESLHPIRKEERFYVVCGPKE